MVSPYEIVHTKAVVAVSQFDFVLHITNHCFIFYRIVLNICFEITIFLF